MKYKPNFLGIGAVRSGSTWLHNILSSHPDFLLPSRRKEIQFFTKYWDKGVDWYYDIFTENLSTNESNFKYIGEITPGYLIAPQGPSRIAKLQHFEKFVLILRNPVNRVISHYKWHLRVTGENPSFEDFCHSLKRISIENSLYYTHLKRYLEYFDLDQFLILIFEEVTTSPEVAFGQLGDFFNVDPSLFSLPEKTNLSTIPRYRSLFKIAHRFTETCRRNDLDWIPNLLIEIGGKKLLESKKTKQLEVEISHEQKELVYQNLIGEILMLESLLKRDLSIWKNN